MKTRFILATVVLLLAVVVGFLAPEPSTTAMYRSTVLSFSFLLLFSRCLSLGALSAGTTMTLTLGIRSGRSPHYIPRFVNDPGFAISPGY